jgi:uncharacterized protein (DUF1800 family)
MLPSQADLYHVAMNRVTFGARDLDVQAARASGWEAWVNEQLAPPKGDDALLRQHLAAQSLRIAYNAPAATDTRGKWLATDEMRPLNYIDADTPTLWTITRNIGTTFAPSERTRIAQELAAATWIRNTHSRYQLREFMADFWHNHFNIGKNENQLATALLPVYDRAVIRPRVFGNFRNLLEATAKSTAMLIYLDNWVSSATTPNENYAREIMELHTLGGAAYLGTANPQSVAKGSDDVAAGFTDQDVIQAARALSGWTVKYGQRGPGTTYLPNTGEFAFNPRQHNANAGTILGVNIAGYHDVTQGRKLLDVLAYHPATATHVVTKLARRIFGDAPPQAVIARGVAAWTTFRDAPDQIGRTVRAILLDGEEIWSAPVAKVRRPYERIIALARTTDTIVNAATFMTSILDAQTDGLFAWPAPNGRPDVNGYWLATGSTMATWNLLFQMPNAAQLTTSLTAQTPAAAATSATTVVEYWVGRLVGRRLPPAAMNTLVNDQAGASGVVTAIRRGNAKSTENAFRRLVSLIATAEEFALR